MQIDVQELRKLEALKLVYIQEDEQTPLLSAKYSQLVIQGNLWDVHPILKQCRGIIFTPDGTVVGKPYTKFFNANEYYSYDFLHTITAAPEIAQKLDGSCIVCFFDPYQELWRCVTLGSFKSDQARTAQQYFEKNNLQKQLDPSCTYLFEYVGPDNRIVLAYPQEDLILTGVVDTKSGYEYSYEIVQYEAGYCGLHAVPLELTQHAIQTLIAENRPNEEGFVFFWPQLQIRVKGKFDWYLEAHRIATGLSKHVVWQKFTGFTFTDKAAGKHTFAVEPNYDAVAALRAEVPEELYTWYDLQVLCLRNQYTYWTNKVDDLVEHLEDRYGVHEPGNKLQKKLVARHVFSEYGSPEQGWVLSAYEKKPWVNAVSAGSLWRFLEPSGVTLFGGGADGGK